MGNNVLSNLGVEAMAQYFANQESLNSLAAGRAENRYFSIEPSVQQTLIDALTEDTGFLSRINIETVDDIKGEKLTLGLDGKIISSRTDVNVEARAPVSAWALDDDKYECRATHFDTFLTYNQIDKWAKFPDFEMRLQKALLEAQRADRIKIGFNGKSHAAKTDRNANPLGEDVNIGWLERLRINAPERVLTEGKNAGEVRFGKDASTDFKNIDALVIMLVNELIEPWHQERNDMRVLISRNLVGDKYFGLYNQAQPSTEILATQTVDLQHRIGRYNTSIVPWFPKNTIAVTFEKNLSIYEQEGSRRRKLQDTAERSRYDAFESFNEDFVIEDYGAMCMAENIVDMDLAAQAAE